MRVRMCTDVSWGPKRESGERNAARRSHRLHAPSSPRSTCHAYRFLGVFIIASAAADDECSSSELIGLISAAADGVACAFSVTLPSSQSLSLLLSAAVACCRGCAAAIGQLAVLCSRWSRVVAAPAWAVARAGTAAVSVGPATPSIRCASMRKRCGTPAAMAGPLRRFARSHIRATPRLRVAALRSPWEPLVGARWCSGYMRTETLGRCRIQLPQ